MHNLNITREIINFQTHCIVKISMGLYNWIMEDLKSTRIEDEDKGVSKPDINGYLSLNAEERQTLWRNGEFCEAFPSMVSDFLSQPKPEPQDAATIVKDFVTFKKGECGINYRTSSKIYEVATGKYINPSVANTLPTQEKATLAQINLAAIFALSLYISKNGHDPKDLLNPIFYKKSGKVSDGKISRLLIVNNGERTWVDRFLAKQGNFTIEEWDKFLIDYYLSYYPIPEGEPIAKKRQPIATIFTNKDTPDMYSKEVLMKLVEYANRFTYTFPYSYKENYDMLDLMVKILKRSKKLGLSEEDIFLINLIIIRINPSRGIA